MNENENLKGVKNLNVRPKGLKLLGKIGAIVLIVSLVATAAYQKFTGKYDNNDTSFASQIESAYNNKKLDLKKAMDLGLVKVYKYDSKTGVCLGEVNYDETLKDIGNYRYELEAPFECGWLSARVNWDYDKIYLELERNFNMTMKSVANTDIKKSYKDNTYSIVHDECEDMEFPETTRGGLTYPNGTFVVVHKDDCLTIQDKDMNVNKYGLARGGKLYFHNGKYIVMTNENDMGYLYVLPDGVVVKKYVYEVNENRYAQYVTSEGITVNIPGLVSQSISSYFTKDGKFRIPLQTWGTNECFSIEGVDFNGNKCTKFYYPQYVEWRDAKGNVIHECGICEEGWAHTYGKYGEEDFDYAMNETTGSIARFDDVKNLLIVSYKNGIDIEFVSENEKEYANIYRGGELIKTIEADNVFTQFYCGDVVEYAKDGIEHMIYFGKYDYSFDENYQVIGKEDIFSSLTK